MVNKTNKYAFRERELSHIDPPAENLLNISIYAFIYFRKWPKMCDKSRFWLQLFTLPSRPMFAVFVLHPFHSFIHISPLLAPFTLSFTLSLSIHLFRSHISVHSVCVCPLLIQCIHFPIARFHSIVRFTFTANINRQNYLNAWYILAPFWQSEY